VDVLNNTQLMDGPVFHAHQDISLLEPEINVSQLLAVELMKLLEMLERVTLVPHAQLGGDQMHCRENV